MNSYEQCVWLEVEYRMERHYETDCDGIFFKKNEVCPRCGGKVKIKNYATINMENEYLDMGKDIAMINPPGEDDGN